MANVSSSNSQKELVPSLRFPGYSDSWIVEPLSSFATRVTRKNTNNETDLPLTISSKDGLVDQISYFNKTVASKDMSGYFLIHKGEYAYNKSYSVGYDFGSIKRLERYPKGALSTLYICFALKRHNSDFIKTYFDSLKWYKEIYMIAAEGARNHGLLNVPTEEFFASRHTIPYDLGEQEKIASFFALLDSRIEKQQRMVDSLKSYKRGLVFELFKSDNRFAIKMEKMPMAALLTEFRCQHSEGLRVCSVAVNRGVVDQVEHLGRSFAAADTSHYGRVKPGDIVYTKSPTGSFPFGIVKQSKMSEDVAVSPLYGVYTPKTSSTGALLHLYFEQSENANNYIRSLAQKGAKNTINITNSRFLEKSILFPVHESDCEKIAQFFLVLDQRIAAEENSLSLLERQKRGLLAQMFL